MSSCRTQTRRAFLAAAASSLGASLVYARGRPQPSRVRWVERRDWFAEGVASGDPDSNSVLLWTRVSSSRSDTVPLTVEVAEDAGFTRVVASSQTRAVAAADHTCRVLVGGLQPARTYWYRFSTKDGSGSRIGRTRTAPAADDPRAVSFAFVSCQNICEGSQHAYRRMIAEDERASSGSDLDFVLHLGDFVYEVVTYPEDTPDGHRYDRRLRDAVRYAEGEAVAGFHVPATLGDYRALYRAYLHDPDIQDARARWPFVAMWDNHEFSWMGWQSFQRFDGKARPAQTRKLMANQAWFEYQPARVAVRASRSLERFHAPPVKDAPIARFDEHGLGREPNNIAAIESLRAYRTLRWGPLLDLIITDQYSHRSEDPASRPEARALALPAFPEMMPEEVMRTLDAGSADSPPQTLLGVEQKHWFLDQLRHSRATWKVWGNSLGTLDWRADPHSGRDAPWPARIRDPTEAATTGPTPSARRSTMSFARKRSRVRHRLRRSTQLLGRLRGEVAAAAAVRSGRRRLHHQLGVGAGIVGAYGTAFRRPSAASAGRRRSTDARRRRQPPAASRRRSFFEYQRTVVRKPRNGVESRSAPSLLSRHGWPRLRGRPPEHWRSSANSCASAAARGSAAADGGSATVSSIVPALACRRSTAARTARRRGRSGARAVMRMPPPGEAVRRRWTSRY